MPRKTKPVWPDPLGAAIYAEWRRQREWNYRRRHALTNQFNGHDGLPGPSVHPVFAAEAARGELVWIIGQGWRYVTPRRRRRVVAGLPQLARAA